MRSKTATNNGATDKDSTKSGIGSKENMGRFFELVAIAIFVGIVFRRLLAPFLRGITGASRGPQQPMRGGYQPPPQQKVPDPKAAPLVDRTKVEDASYRDID